MYLLGDSICVLEGLVFVFATMISKKYQTITPLELLFVRCCFHLMCVVYLKFRGKNFTIYSRSNLKALAATAMTGFLGIFFNLAYLYSLKHIPPADMFAIQKFKLVVTGVAAMFLFGEVFGTIELGASIIILCGEAVLAQPPLIFGGDSSAYADATFIIWLAVAFTILSSGMQPVLLRYAIAHGTKEFKSDVSDYLLCFASFGLVILNSMGTPVLLATRTTYEWFVMCSYASFAMSASMLFKISLDYITSARYAVVNCTVVPLSFIMDAVAGTGTPRLSGFLGATIVTLGVVFYSVVQYYRQLGAIKGVWSISISHQKF